MRTSASNLWQMGNSYHLMLCSQFFQYISDFIGYDELWVRKKLEQLTKIASDNRSLFLEMSKQEEDEIIEEYMDSVGLEGI